MNDEMKTSVEDFKRFIYGFKRWQVKLGLTDTACVFRHQYVEGAFAGIRYDQTARLAVVMFSTHIPQRDADYYDPCRTSRHEALELLLARFAAIARSRYCFPDDISEESHAIIRRLEQAFDSASEEQE